MTPGSLMYVAEPVAAEPERTHENLVRAGKPLRKATAFFNELVNGLKVMK